MILDAQTSSNAIKLCLTSVSLREILPRGPTQELEFLGFLIDSKQMTLSVTEKKLRSLISCTMQEALGCPTDHDSITCSHN